MSKFDFETHVVKSLDRIERRLSRLEIKTAAIAATVALLIRWMS
jgi:hypothetical protein